MDYLILKWIHILSSTVLFGTGIGLAFYFFAAHRSRDLRSIQFVTKMVVLGDLLFTTPAGIVQIASGVLLINELGFSWTEPWLMTAIILVAFAAVCWFPVVWMQIKMRDISSDASSVEELDARYWLLDRYWIALGSLAFPALIAVFWLMVAKPELW